jgi:hypothetical protein
VTREVEAVSFTSQHLQGETGCIEVKYTSEPDDREHRPVFLPGETTPFFYERIGRS